MARAVPALLEASRSVNCDRRAWIHTQRAAGRIIPWDPEDPVIQQHRILSHFRNPNSCSMLHPACAEGNNRMNILHVQKASIE